MSFWSLGRGSSASTTQGSAALELAPHLEPIQVFLEDRLINGTMAPDGERVTDLLSTREGIRVKREDDVWEEIPVAEIILVAPPPHSSQRRIHRARRRVELTADPYTVTGTAHLPPGTQLDPFVLRTGRRFLPVTGAWVRIEGDDASEQHLDVAIVSVQAISVAKELLGLV